MCPLKPTYSKVQLLLLVLTFALTQLSHAQIGINTLTPDSTAALDINGNGTKGVLIPRITKNQRESLSLKAVDGLLVYDKTQKMFYFWDGDSKQWESLNLFKNVANSTDTNIVINNKLKKVNVGIGYSGIGTDKPANKLDVKGAIKTDTVKASFIGVNLGTNKPTERVEVSGNVKATSIISNSVITNSVITNSITSWQTPPTDLSVNSRIRDKSGYVAPVGSMMMYAGYFAPTGWLICDGQVYNRTDYPDLSAVIGYNFGGTATTFNVPDMRRRAPVGAGGTPIGPLGVALGNTGGEEMHTLSILEMPTHNHNVLNLAWAYNSGANDQPFTFWDNGGSSRGYFNTDNAGGNQPHNNIQPSIIVNFIIKY
jgi:microcystin-dependent protein